jgi:hypothetical protein
MIGDSYSRRLGYLIGYSLPKAARLSAQRRTVPEAGRSFALGHMQTNYKEEWARDNLSLAPPPHSRNHRLLFTSSPLSAMQVFLQNNCCLRSNVSPISPDLG